MVYSPIFDEAPNGAGAEKSRCFDGDSHALRDFDDGADVVFHGACGAIRPNLHPRRGNFARQGLRVGKDAGTCPGEADVHRVDAEGFHQVENFDFFFDAGVVDRGILQAVAQGFVIQEDARAGGDLRRRGQVPVVDPFVLWHAPPSFLHGQLWHQHLQVRFSSTSRGHGTWF